jgi:hypothetical protein
VTKVSKDLLTVARVKNVMSYYGYDYSDEDSTENFMVFRWRHSEQPKPLQKVKLSLQNHRHLDGNAIFDSDRLRQALIVEFQISALGDANYAIGASRFFDC